MPSWTVATIILVTSLAVVDDVAWASCDEEYWSTVSRLFGDCLVSHR